MIKSGRCNSPARASADMVLTEPGGPIQAFYGISKRYLRIYEKLVKEYQKPVFVLNGPINLADA
jgi:hypothetical protein